MTTKEQFRIAYRAARRSINHGERVPRTELLGVKPHIEVGALLVAYFERQEKDAFLAEASAAWEAANPPDQYW